MQYIAQVSNGSSSDLAAARAVNADKYAPYEFTAAVEYLHKAREEEGYADHAAALHFGKLAADFAQKAREIALAQTAAGVPAPTGPPAAPPVAPTGDGEEENPIQPPPPPAKGPRK